MQFFWSFGILRLRYSGGYRGVCAFIDGQLVRSFLLDICTSMIIWDRRFGKGELQVGDENRKMSMDGILKIKY